MKSNNALTYVLFGLLGLFILAAGYYACEKQRRAKEAALAEEKAEQDEMLRNQGYLEDSTATAGSSFAADTVKPSAAPAKPGAAPAKPNSAAGSKNSVSKDGIEDSGATTKQLTTTKPKSPATTTKPKTTTKGVSAVKGPGAGRWAVRAGTFAYMEGARRRLEEIIKAGYPNAEISKTKEGKAAVVVFRSNDKNAAIRVVDQLEEKGFDAAVFDRNN